MKLIFTLILTLLGFVASQAQVRMGIIGGPQSSKVIEKNDIPGWDSTTKNNYSKRGSFHLGVLIEVPLSSKGDLFFQPGIYFSGKGQKYSEIYDTPRAIITDTAAVKIGYITNYMEIPLNISYHLPIGKKVKFMASAGPYIGLYFSGKQTIESRAFSNNKFTSDESDIQVGNETGKVKTMDFGLNARAGFDLGKVFLTGYISQGLKNFYKAPYDGTFKHQVIGFSLGVWINKTVLPPAKPKDKDHDGVTDDQDACPDLAGSAATNGCPDKDGDGVPDKDDKCPDIAGTAKWQGCPVPDSDKDGINDDEDKCPLVEGKAKYNGCPIPDTDGDGVNDEEDSCINKPGLAEYHGCPIPDTDGDGVNDKEDKCPTEAGTKENNGCPEIKQEIVEKVNFVAQNIMFGLGSDRLSPQSNEPLMQVVEILKANPNFKLTIEGHTDNTGNAKWNLSLSQKRANAVKAFMVSKGIATERLTAKGFGSSQPIDPNNTEEARSKNRRVELKLDQ